MKGLEVLRRAGLSTVVVMAGALSVLPAPEGAAAFTGTYATDSFDRTVVGGLGNAPLGGAYQLSGGSAADFQVADGVAKLTLTGAGASRSAALPKVVARDVDVRSSFRWDRPATGWGTQLYLAARTVDSYNEYRMRARIAPDARVYVQVLRSTGAGEVALAPEQVVPGVTATPGSRLWLRGEAAGASPTTVRARAWLDGQAEPTSWATSGVDGTAALQVGGGVAIRSALSGDATAFPLQLAVDDFAATDPSVSTPVLMNTFFVSPTGDDSGDGSLDKPWRTPQHAADVAGSGSAIYLFGGSYPGFRVQRSGLTFAAAAGGTAVISGSGDIITLDGASDVTIRNLTVEGATAPASTGILVANGSNVRIQSNLIHRINGWGVRTWNATGVTIQDSEIAGTAIGVEFAYRADGNRVLNNRIHDNISEIDPNDRDGGGGVGILFSRTTGAITASGNALWRNRAPLNDGTYDGSNFEVFGASDLTITNNVMWDAEHAMETGTDGPPCNNLVFTNNIAYGASSIGGWAHGLLIACASGNSVIANNVLDGFDIAALSLVNRADYRFQGSLDGLRVTDNILSSTGTQLYHIDGTFPRVQVDRNTLWSKGGWLGYVVDKGTTNSLNEFRQWTGFDLNGAVQDPQYTDWAGHNYTLRSTSPLLAPKTATANVAVDGFGRTVSGGWGPADVGGAYSLHGGGADYSVNAGAGTMTLGAAWSTRLAWLNDAATTDTRFSFGVRANQAPQGGGYYASMLARRVDGSNLYLTKLRFDQSGRVYLQLSRIAGGAEALLTGEVQAAGVAYTPNALLWVRGEVVGTAPTTLRLKVWAEGTPEPSAWQVTATDSTPALQTAGAPGLHGYLADYAGSPLTLSFRDFVVTR